MTVALPWVGAGVIVAIALVVLGRWLGAVAKLCLRTCGGFLLLTLIQPLGLGVGANGVTALVLGVLGAPGFGLLLLLPWVLG